MATSKKVPTAKNEADTELSESNTFDKNGEGKKDFARRLYQAMRAKNWNQSELARAAFGTLKDQRGYTVPRRRDSVSNYLQGKAYPDMKSREALAKALGVRVEDLMPNIPSMASKDGTILELTQVPNNPGMMRIRIDKTVEADQAMEIWQILRKSDENE